MAAKSIKILLLEDDTAHAEAIMRELKDTRYKVRVAGTLREYYESVAADPPDIALLDMALPDGGAKAHDVAVLGRIAALRSQ